MPPCAGDVTDDRFDRGNGVVDHEVEDKNEEKGGMKMMVMVVMMLWMVMPTFGGRAGNTG